MSGPRHPPARTSPCLSSNGHTTRSSARERPGDAASVFALGGAEPRRRRPDDDDAKGEDDSLVVPGFGGPAATAGAGAARCGSLGGVVGSAQAGVGLGVDDVVPRFGGGVGDGAGSGGNEVPGFGGGGGLVFGPGGQNGASMS